MIVALAGGVGGAKLARGLAEIAGADLSVIVNTGDDFDHFDLRICPDLDTITYTLAGKANAVTGWGVEGETWSFMAQIKALGGEDWFQLGDRDLAIHVLRSQWLRQGMSLTDVTAKITAALGVKATVLPMSDAPIRTRVQTASGLLEFQDYFVRLKCDVAVTGVRFDGASEAGPTESVERALDDAEVLIFCPSNPFVSIDPILAITGIHRRLKEKRRIACVAVSPIIGGKAVKGPAAKMMAELGYDVSSLAVAEKYRGLVDGMVIDMVDADLAEDIRALGMAVKTTRTLMLNSEDSVALAAETIAFAREICGR
jgi:LPPG:FO 2-phospho-L-lactate transferase